MAQVLITGIFAFLFLQLATSQDACQDAINTLTDNVASCTDPNNPLIICSGQCRQYYDAVIRECDQTTAAAQQQALDAACGTATTTPATTAADTTAPATTAADTTATATTTAAATTSSATDNIDQCLVATQTLSNNAASCTGTDICSGDCRTYYEDVISSCSTGLEVQAQQALDAVCGSSGAASVFNGLGVYSLLLLSVMAAVVF